MQKTDLVLGQWLTRGANGPGTGDERDDLVRSLGERTGRKSGRFGGHKLGHCTHNELGVAGTWTIRRH
jgi:hypothetical protein